MRIRIRQIILIVFIISLFGCAKRMGTADDYARLSEDYFNKAVQQYQAQLFNSKDADRMHYALGELYYNHGRLDDAARELLGLNSDQARRLYALVQYKLGNYTDALDYFSKLEALHDGEYLYYYGMTCEKLNLYDRAISLYKKIDDANFKELANQRIAEISRSTQSFSSSKIGAELKGIIENAPPADKYPQAGALILYADEKIEVTGQNTIVSSSYFVVKIINERGKKEFSEIATDYDSTDEKVELESALVIKPDGKVVEVGSRHIRDVSKYLNFPLYSNVRVHIVSLPEIVDGAVVAYRIKITQNRMVNKKDFCLSYPVRANEPVIHARFSFIMPQERAVNIKYINQEYLDYDKGKADLSPKITKHDAKTEYFWEFNDIPQIIPEPDMPPEVEINPTILFSTFKSWDEIYNWWWSLAKDKISADENIKNKVLELTKGLKGDEEKARAIYNFCAQDIRYVAVEYGEAGHEPHKAEDVFLNKYGDCKDKAILLVTMLRDAGLKAFPVLIGTKDYFNLLEDFPSILFDHAIAALALDGKILFLDATAETCSFSDLPAGDQERKVLLFKDDAYKIVDIPLFAARHNLVTEDTIIKVANDETISAEKKVFTTGLYDQAQRYWLTYSTPKQIEDMLKTKIQDVSIGAKLLGYKIDDLDDLNKAVVLSYSYSGPEYFTVADNMRILPQLSKIETSQVAQDERRYPIDFSVLEMSDRQFRIELPNNLVIKYLPQSLEKDSPWLKYRLEYKSEDGSIVFKEVKEWKVNQVPTKEYQQFKHFIEDLAKLVKQRAVLVTK